MGPAGSCNTVLHENGDSNSASYSLEVYTMHAMSEIPKFNTPLIAEVASPTLLKILAINYIILTAKSTSFLCMLTICEDNDIEPQY